VTLGERIILTIVAIVGCLAFLVLLLMTGGF
jgi:hypothetical protein